MLPQLIGNSHHEYTLPYWIDLYLKITMSRVARAPEPVTENRNDG